MIPIQEDLVALVAERRLIPFLGAGFSASLGLPSWESMLREVCDNAEGTLPFDELMTATNNDLLQVAEYLYLRHDRQIGPIRHQIERSFSRSSPRPLLSGPHVELVNLGAGQIYTTNYDDIIEQTYRQLKLPVTPVILPKDVALADQDRTQVVKYHGDLTHERTLVLTESAYYKRLDFESPMDLKFRSDLLGKSVLFMGYSFRDINIRIIWFKLMDMMRDIPEADRRPSYIVRFEPNPALEELYAAVGLRTIVLNPSGPVADDKERTKLLGEFLLSLSIRAEKPDGGSNTQGASRYVSQALLVAASALVDKSAQRLAVGNVGVRRRYSGLFRADQPILRRLLTGAVPAPLQTAWEETVVPILPYLPTDEQTFALIPRLTNKLAIAQFVVGVLAENGNSEARAGKRQLLAAEVPWAQVWSATFTSKELLEILDAVVQEIQYQATGGADEDIAYLAELANRIAHGQFVDHEAGSDDGISPADIVERARDLVEVAASLYPSIAKLEVTDGPPDVEKVLREIRKRESNFEPVDIDLERLFGHSLFALRSRNHRTVTRGRVPRPPRGGA